MVTVGVLSFPKTNTVQALVGTLNVPYHSTNGNYKLAFFNTTVNAFMSFTNYQAQPMTITVNLSTSSSINVYKNSVLYGTTSNFGTDSLSKGFVFPNLASQVVCRFNSYYFNIGLGGFQVPANNNVGTTDVYTFFQPITYTITSTVSSLLYTGNFTYIVSVGNPTITSDFTNFSYASGSLNTSGYSVTNNSENANMATAWDGSSGTDYVPTVTNPSLWTGLYQLQTLYSNNLFPNQISLKNRGFTNTISWYDTDARGSSTLGSIYVSIISNAYNFYINNTATIFNGFRFTGGNINSSSQQQTWYVTSTGGTGTTIAGNRIGANTNGGSFFNTLTVNGGALSSAFSTTTAIFTAPVNGTYFIQLNVFNNGVNTIGRTLQFISSSSTQPSQYCFFNEQATTTECSFNWTTLVYLPAGGTAYFKNSGGPTVTFYYGNGHTNLTITKIF